MWFSKDATICMSNLLVKQEDICGTGNSSSKGIRSVVSEALNWFCLKFALIYFNNNWETNLFLRSSHLPFKNKLINLKEEIYSTINSYYKYTSIPNSSFNKINILILLVNTGEKYLKYSIHFAYICDYQPLWI